MALYNTEIGAYLRRYDPDLHASAMFAPMDMRARLMRLYAFDVEISRAFMIPNDPMIARIRLQWWRDLVHTKCATIVGQAIAKQIEPLFSEPTLDHAVLLAMIDAREKERMPLMTQTDFHDWISGRFMNLLGAGAAMLSNGHAPSTMLAREMGFAMGIAFVLRNAVPLAMECGHFILPGLDAPGRSALARGITTPGASQIARGLAQDAISRLKEIRHARKNVAPSALPVFLAGWRSDAVLGRAMAGDRCDLARLPMARPRLGRGLSLMWRSMSGRW